MELLVLGGTQFLGRAVVAAARDAGHRVSVFTRGLTNPDVLAPDVERLVGNRDGDLRALEGRRWDAVVDTSGYVPRVVADSVRLLQRSVEVYAFVSTISVYASLDEPPGAETPLAELPDPACEDVVEHYGAMKAACEQAVRRGFGDRALVLRPGLIGGPHDPIGRLTYWVQRVAAGGDVLAAGEPGRPVQVIDVRDLAEWTVRMAAEGACGTFDAVGPEPRPSMGELLDACRAAAGADARLVWADDGFLLEHGVREWDELPLWIADPRWASVMSVDPSRAVAAGLTYRPVEETVRATLAWARDPRTPRLTEQMPPRWLTRERERELLEAWWSAALTPAWAQ